MRTGRLIGAGRTADVYEAGAGWVLRRDREGAGDAVAEGAVMEHVRAHGYPVPRVRPGTTPSPRTDLVMERLSGPTMLRACLDGALTPRDAGGTLARLLRLLHEVPAYRSTDPGVRVLHLDLHPDNVILTADGPRVIDWSNAEEGDPALDWATSAVILAQVAAVGGPMAEPAAVMLAALLASPSALTPDGLAEALRRRAANPTMSPREVAVLPAAGELVRSHLG
ncbi:phosphotransferase [Streptomyces violaceorubidus]|uniref:phosphotransferase n=1 Tax=Streptomyces violaceorubidus TaxID=284042 RepID=UPI0004BFD8CE|nr:phosphotransferase [Streptomyces violaceorubidus]